MLVCVFIKTHHQRLWCSAVHVRIDWMHTGINTHKRQLCGQRVKYQYVYAFIIAVILTLNLICYRPAVSKEVRKAEHKRLKSSDIVRHPARFVVISSSVTDVVHETPYAVLLPLSARSWLAAGFCPMFLLAVHDPASWRTSSFARLLLRELGAIPGALIFIIPALSKFIEVSLSQVSRLFAGFLLPDVELDSYLRLTDADMLIYQAWPFQTENISGVHIYNGNCCLPQRPMHSIGMSVRLWRQLFSVVLPLPIRQCSPETLAQALTSWLAKQGVDENKPMPWAQREWSLDQVLAGQVINRMSKEVRLTVSPVVGRVHYPHHDLTQTNPAGDVVESHEHRIVFSQLLHLQRRIDLSVLRESPVFQNWNWTLWVTEILNTGQ